MCCPERTDGDESRVEDDDDVSEYREDDRSDQEEGHLVSKRTLLSDSELN